MVVECNILHQIQCLHTDTDIDMVLRQRRRSRLGGLNQTEERKGGRGGGMGGGYYWRVDGAFRKSFLHVALTKSCKVKKNSSIQT